MAAPGDRSRRSVQDSKAQRAPGRPQPAPGPHTRQPGRRSAAREPPAREAHKLPAVGAINVAQAGREPRTDGAGAGQGWQGQSGPRLTASVRTWRPTAWLRSQPVESLEGDHPLEQALKARRDNFVRTAGRVSAAPAAGERRRHRGPLPSRAPCAAGRVSSPCSTTRTRLYGSTAQNLICAGPWAMTPDHGQREGCEG